MFTVIFEQDGQTWTTSASRGETLFDIAKVCDAPVETLCHGIGACVRCKVTLVEGELSKPTPLERDRLGNIFHLTGERLACQAQIQGDIRLLIRKIRQRKRRR